MNNTQLRNEQVWLAVGSLMIIATVALAAALVYTRDVMIPFVLSIFITTAVSPIVDFQVRRWRIPSIFAVLSTLMLVFAALTLFGAFVVVAVQTMAQTAYEYSAQVDSLTKDMLTRVNEHLTSWKLEEIKFDQSAVSTELKSLLPDLITRMAGTVTTLVSHGFLILFFVVFLLVGRNPDQKRENIYTEIESTIRGYITTMNALAAFTAILVGITLWGLRLHMAWLFAFLVFLFTFIPNIGPIVATLLPVPVAVAQFQNPWMVLAVVAIPGAIHMVVGNLITPKVMGRGLELHPVTVLLALAFWGLLWGIVGMVLAVPIVAMIRIVLSHFSTTRFLADLLAGRLPGTARPTSPSI
ncbi:MAG: AI-2E family transporter [Pirellulales bacterium]